MSDQNMTKAEVAAMKKKMAQETLEQGPLYAAVTKKPKLGKFNPQAKKPVSPVNLGNPPFTPSDHVQKLINEQIGKLVGENLNPPSTPDAESVEWEYYCWAAPMPDQDITNLYLVRHGFWEDAPVSQYARIISSTKMLTWVWYFGTQKIMPLVSFHWAQMQHLTQAQAKKLTKALGGLHQKQPMPVEDDWFPLDSDDEEPGGWTEGTAFVPMGIEIID